MKKISLLLLFGAFILSGCTCGKAGFKSLNARAAEEYLVPVRQGGVDGSPFWNEFCDKFTYAPAFDFAPSEDAAAYRFDVWYVDDLYRNERLLPASQRPSADEMYKSYSESSKLVATFTADSPKASLSPVWNDIPVGQVGVVVTAVDADGKDISHVGTREFLRDFPFQGPYPKSERSYREAAHMALMFMDRYRVTKDVRAGNISENSRPTELGVFYACKFLSAVIKSQILLSEFDPHAAETHIETARKAADFLISLEEPEGAPLEHFPPTYYHSQYKPEQTMSMEPLYVFSAFLNLYDVTSDKKYFDEAIAIARTYDKIVDENGFIPKKLIVATGKGVNDAGALTGVLISDMKLLKDKYGVEEFEPLRERCERWMQEVAMKNFDMSAQFEDISVEGLLPYQNLTNIMPNNFAQYLLSKDNPTEEEIAAAKDLARFVEDQFIHWDLLKMDNGLKEFHTPGVYEQYYCAICIDGSTATTANTFMDLYEVTGDRLYLEKARALVDAIVISQNPCTGEIPTFWAIWYHVGQHWINCSLTSVNTILRFDNLINS